MEYEATLEQIAFDISHVLRRPVTTILGIVNLIELEQDLSPEDLKVYSSYIQTVSQELDTFTRELNDIYSKKKQKITRHNKRIKN